MRTLGWTLGLAVLAGYVAGCNSDSGGKPYAESEANAPNDEAAHAHHEHGPHGGHIIEFSGDHSVHGEFVIDDASKTAKLYLTGADMKTPVMGSALEFHAVVDGNETEVEMQPVAADKASGDKASEFTAPLTGLPSTDIEKLSGHFHVTVDGKELSGDLGHDDHDHDHADDHDHAAEPVKP